MREGFGTCVGPVANRCSRARRSPERSNACRRPSSTQSKRTGRSTSRPSTRSSPRNGRRAGSGMVANKAYANLERLRAHDEVKFVLLDRADYEFAKGVLSKVDTPARTVLFSPATPAHQVVRGLDPGALASWILEERLPVRLQLQLHKLIWPGRDRGI